MVGTLFTTEVSCLAYGPSQGRILTSFPLCTFIPLTLEAGWIKRKIMEQVEFQEKSPRHVSRGHIRKVWRTGYIGCPERIQHPDSRKRKLRWLLQLGPCALLPALHNFGSHEASSCLCGAGFGGSSAHVPLRPSLYVTNPKWVPFQMLICEVNKWKGHEKIHLNIVSHNDSGSLVVEKNSSLQRNPTHHSVSCGEAARNGGFLHIKCTRSHLPPDDNDGNWQASPLSIIVKLRL